MTEGLNMIPVHEQPLLQGARDTEMKAITDALMKRLADEGLCLVKAADYDQLKQQVQTLQGAFDAFIATSLGVDIPSDAVFKAFLHPGEPLPEELRSDSLGLK